MADQKPVTAATITRWLYDRSRHRRRNIALMAVHTLDKITTYPFPDEYAPRSEGGRADQLDRVLYSWENTNPAIVLVEFPEGESFEIKVTRKGMWRLSNGE